MDIWEAREVRRPPEYTVQYSAKERSRSSLDLCVQSLLEAVLCGHAVLCDEAVSSCFQREVAILTASLYQNGRHRTEKFYRVLRKLEKCCRRWLDLNMAKELDRLRQLMPAVSPVHKSIRMPSKQMFEYLLIRALGGYYLLLHVDGVCREAAGLLMAKISTGHFFSTAMAFLSNVARIRALALDMSGQLAKLYDDLLPWMNQLKSSEAAQLVSTESLPPTLSDHLKQYWSSVNINSNSVHRNQLPSSTSFLESLRVVNEEEIADVSKVDELLSAPFSEDSFLYKNSPERDCKMTHEHHHTPNLETPMEEDIGECVNSGSKPSTKTVHKDRNKDHQVPGLEKTIEEDIGECVSNVKKSSSKKRQKDHQMPSPEKRMEEDIGECVSNSKEFSSTQRTTKKRKLSAKVHKTSKLPVSCMQVTVEDSESIPSELPKSSLKKKRRKNKQELVNSSKSTSMSKSKQQASLCITPAFVKQYKTVKKQTKRMTTLQDLRKFLQTEKKNRLCRTVDRLSLLLKKRDWQEFSKFLRGKLKGVRGMEVDSGDSSEVQKSLTKIRIQVKFWMLFPKLRGQKPDNWKAILGNIGKQQTNGFHG